ncbi:MAG: SPOR domain-containing protein [Thalassotalea sp.]
MSAVAKVSVNENSNGQLTNISVNARIDYILRFSKQAVFSIAQEAQDYSAVCSHFLSNLNSAHNAAYISLAGALQDIQIRSRIIEQLFNNVLFDPEQSLALSIINLVKSHPQKISIAIDHGQHISLQVLHELTQLAEIAKKSQLTIDILVCGNHILGRKLAQNSILFKNKTSIICAESGQLIALSASAFKEQKTWFKAPSWSLKKVLIFTLLLMLIGFSVVLFNLLLTGKIIKPVPKVLPQKVPVEVFAMSKGIAKSLENNASYVDILSAIESIPTKPSEQASSEEVAKLLLIEAEPIALTPPVIVENKTPMVVKNSDWYLATPTGFVIQFAAFSDEKVKNDFIKQFPSLDYISYFRLIDGQKFEVLTSKPYKKRDTVETALSAMPESLKSLNIWIKQLKTIKSEIKHFQSSQS